MCMYTRSQDTRNHLKRSHVEKERTVCMCLYPCVNVLQDHHRGPGADLHAHYTNHIKLGTSSLFKICFFFFLCLNSVSLFDPPLPPSALSIAVSHLYSLVVLQPNAKVRLTAWRTTTSTSWRAPLHLTKDLKKDGYVKCIRLLEK